MITTGLTRSSLFTRRPSELLCRSVPRFADPLARQNFHQRLAENPEIEPKGLVINIPHVERELLLPGNIVSSVHLSPAGNSRQYFVTTKLLLVIAIAIVRMQRARPDQAHLSAKYAEHFGKLIEARRPQKTAGRSNPL